jgi:hypothetical protein
MPQHSDVQTDQRLAELERDLGPALRVAYGGYPLRAGFRSELRQELNTMLSSPKPHPSLRALGQRGWAALAAVLVIGMASSVALFANRPQPASAAEVLDKVQAEAISASTVAAVDAASCSPPSEMATTGGMVFATGPADGGPVEMQPGTATQLSDRLAQALGVTGDKFRQAMLQAIAADLPPSLPPDPFAAIGQHLGVSRQQVCAAFVGTQTPSQGLTVSHAAGGDRAPRHNQVLNLNGIELDPDHIDPGQLSAPAQRLGVSPERLAAAVRDALPPPAIAPPTPASKDEIISRLARNLGTSEDRVRTAITQVEGPNHFYFAVPLPGQPKP